MNGIEYQCTIYIYLNTQTFTPTLQISTFYSIGCKRHDLRKFMYGVNSALQLLIENSVSIYTKEAKNVEPVNVNVIFQQYHLTISVLLVYFQSF